MVQNKFKIQWFAFALTALACVGVLFFSAHGVYAQDAAASTGNAGLDTVQQTSGLGNASFGLVVARIIRVILSILGIVTLGFVIFGGFLWMTAGGSEETLDKAKKTISNGVIGLVITLSAFAITQFVMTSLSNATGTQTGFNTDTNTDNGGNLDTGYLGGGGGTISSGGLQVKAIMPKGTQLFANLQVSILFTGAIDETTVGQNVKITDSTGDVPGQLTVKGDSVSFVPTALCAEPNASKHCFASGVEYTVTVSGGKGGIVSATTKKALTCSAASCTAKFIAGDKVDVMAPIISNTDPKNNDKIPTDQIIPIQALLSDENSIALGRVSINGVILETVSTNAGLQEFLLQSKKFTTKGDAANKEYEIAISAEDIAGNTSKLLLKVKTSPQHCFDKKMNVDEIDIDCGAPGGSCSACTNIACKKDVDCANGTQCDPLKNSCTASPSIKSVQPQDGAPGTFVTLGGEGFGTQTGEVVFLGDVTDSKDDQVAGPACVGGWSDTQSVVQVPENAVSGPIQLKNAAGSQDVTNDADGLKLTQFLVNDVQRPGLCSVSPTSGLPAKTKITITGNEYLSNSALERKLFIGGYLIDKAVWGEAGANTVTGFIPPFEPAKVNVQVTIKSIASNPLELVIEDANASVPAASISGLELDKGPAGQYITVKGAGFGTTPNKVYFVVVDAAGKLTNDQTSADFNFPQQCAKNFWKDTQVIIKVPKLPKGTYAVVVQPFGKSKQSSYKLFTITEDKLGPQICALVTDTGPADGIIKVTLYGENFGTSAGAVIFNNKFVSKPVSGGSGWSNNATTVVVPAGVVTGEVKLAQAQNDIAADTCVKNAATCSNPVTYTVLDCRVTQKSCLVGTMCCGDGSCQKDCAVGGAKPVKGVFAWCFSTGDSCDVVQPPRVTEECGTGVGSKVIPSPSPSAMWPSTAAGGACGNAMIAIKFTDAVDPTSVTINAGSQSALLVEECTGTVSEDSGCEKVAAQPLELSGLQVQDKIDEKNAGLFAVPKNLKASTRYKVTLSNTIVGFDTGLQLMGPDKPKTGNECKPSGNGVYCYFFTTSEKQGECDVDSVAVAPTTYNAVTLGAIHDPLSKTGALFVWSPVPSPADKCQVLDPSGYSWNWTPAKKLDKDFDFAESSNSLATYSPFVAKSPTAGKAPATISVKETKSGKIGTGTLSIDLGVPLLTEQCSINGPRSPSPSSQWGGEICADAPIVVEFNQPVVNKGADGKEGSLALKLSECNGKVEGKECDTVVTPGVETGFKMYKFSDTRYAYAFQPTNSLAKGVSYLAEVPMTTKGEGQFGKQMAQKTGCRTGVAYCFTFKTSADQAQCKIDSVEVSPFSWKAVEYGVQQTYVKGDLVDQMWHSQAFGKNQCVWLKDDYKWSWYVDKEHLGYAAINPAVAAEGQQSIVGLVGKYWSSSPDQSVAAYKETHADESVRIIAAAEGIEGKGSMDIVFPSPTVLSYQPSACGGAGVCVGSAPDVQFSVAMNVGSLSDHTFLFQCPAEKDDKTDCLFTDADIAAAQKMTATALVSNNGKLVYAFLPSVGMQLDTKYRVVIADGARSTAEKKFTGFNYPDINPKYFSWTYTITKDQCAPQTISVHPVKPMAQAQGEKLLFTAAAYSAPDSCYAEGQLLNPNNFKWSWWSSDSDVAKINVVTTTNKQSFLMEAKGVVSLVDNTQTSIISASTGGVSGMATWKLQCSSYKPSDCPKGTWPGSDHCCHLPPSVSKTYPVGDESDICRNTLMTIDATDWIAASSVSTTSIRLAFRTENSEECSTGEMEGDYCFDQIPYSLTTINSKDEKDKLTGRVILNLNQVLPAKRVIVLRIRAVDSDDPELVGLRSTKDVPIIGTEVRFETGTNFCELTDVKVFPEETTLTKLSDTQIMYSYGLSKQGNMLVPLSAVPDMYTWSLEWFTNSAKIAKYVDDTKHATAKVVPGGLNGQTSVTALATITMDTLIKPTTEGKTVAGAANVEASLCELPWFPQKEAAITNVLTKYNFDFWYCRYADKVVLPKLNAVKDELSDINANNFTTQDSFRLIDPLSGGAIGFRVESNLKQYSALEWYYQKQFTGEVTPIGVDGFSGVRVGNTVYIAFGNQYNTLNPKTTQQFTNILVISLSEPATPEMKNIFDQIIDGMQFVKNIKDVGLCYNNTGPTNQMCSTNSGCVAVPSQSCHVDQSKFRRDTLRVIDSSVMVRAIQKAKAFTANGGCAAGPAPVPLGKTFVRTILKDTSPTIQCNSDTPLTYNEGLFDPIVGALTDYKSNTFSVGVGEYKYADQNTAKYICNTKLPIGTCDKYPVLSCVGDYNCPNSKCIFPTLQACQNEEVFAGLYPIIPKDTFIPGLSSSRWPSWDSFMQQLGINTLVDPINEYASCADGADPITCWNVKSKQYSCGLSSSVYHYQTISSGVNFALGIPLEQSVSEQSSWNKGFFSLDVQPKIKNDNFCTGQAVKANTVCGDGAIGAGEECDPVGSDVTGMDASKYNLGKGLCSKYGKFTAKCSSTCQVEKIQCVNLCGDGIVQSPAEQCDDGAKYNGQYNHCGATCQLDDLLGSCGNGVKEKNEACDIGTPNGKYYKYFTNSSKISFSVKCELKKSAVLLERMEFEFTSKTFNKPGPQDDVKLYDQFVLKYASQIENFCGGDSKKYGWCKQYTQFSCLTNADCIDGDTCLNPAEGTKYTAKQVDSCNWNCKSTGAYCGDGIVNTQNGEQCDGDVRGDQCTNVCIKETCKWETLKANSTESWCKPDEKSAATAMLGCGDGVLNPSGVEECDLGTACIGTETSFTNKCTAGGTNGVPCVPQYGQNNSCQYCTASCKKGYVSGGFCGDGKTAGPEICDGYDTQAISSNVLMDYNTYVCSATCDAKDASAGGTEYSCATQTGLATTGADVSASKSEYKKIAIKLTDTTLGWLPVKMTSSLQSNRKEKASVLVSAKVSAFPVSTPGAATPVTLLNGWTIDLGKPYANNTINSCIGNGRSYSMSISPIDTQVGGAFSYLPSVEVFEDKTNLTKDVDVHPMGQEGDYRIVISGDVPWVIISEVPQSQYSGSSIMPDPNGYSVIAELDNFKGLVPEKYITCKNNGYLAVKGGTASKYATDNTSNVVATMSWDDGCSTGMPFTQIEHVSAVGNSKNIQTVVTIRRAFQNGYYAALYKFKALTSDTKATASIYYFDSNNVWKKVAEVHPTDSTSLFNNGTWSMFYLQPTDVKILNSTAVATKYQPADALYGGLTETSLPQNKLPLLP